MAFKHGNKGRFQINAVALKTTNWNVNETVDDGDTTHSESGGFKEQIAGNKQIVGELTGNWDTARKPTGVPIMVAGSIITNIILYLDAGTTVVVNIPSADVTSFRVNSQVNGVISFTASFKSNGSYTWG